MKWKTPPKPLEPWEDGKERDGETREYYFFAFYPVACEDGTTRWFETVLVHEKWGKIYSGIRGAYTWGWKDTTFRALEKNKHEKSPF